MDDNVRSEVINNFATITGVDHDRARFYLESSNWNLDISLASFYDDNDGDVESNLPSAPPTEIPVARAATTKKPEKKAVIKPAGKLVNLVNVQDQHSDESSDDEDGQAFYAGGSEHSGQQVLGPPRGRRGDIVSDMFKSVREYGAEVVEAHSSSSKGPQNQVFSGTGYRLGETSGDSEVVNQTKSDDQSQVEITLKFWKNGFSVNNGPLRSYDDPKSQEFLHHIKQREVPNELVMQAQGREISFNMEDYRHAEYVGTAPKRATFIGSGQKLGSVTPTLSSPTPTSETTSENNSVEPNPVKVDNSKPTTNIQIRLADGSRLVGTFNYNHTIGDIRSYINASSPQYRDRRYILISTFPRKEFTNNEDTIEQSGLINSVVMQHLTA